MKILSTQPLDPALSGLPGPGMGDYLLTLEDLLTKARHSVDIVCPFIDSTGLAILAAAYDRSPRTASWRLFLRGASAAASDVGGPRGWQVYGYVGTPGGEERRGFHCKIFIADEERAIVGSANLIYHNLVENVEIGVLLEGEEVRTLLQVPRAIRRASTRITA